MPWEISSLYTATKLRWIVASPDRCGAAWRTVYLSGYGRRGLEIAPVLSGCAGSRAEKSAWHRQKTQRRRKVRSHLAGWVASPKRHAEIGGVSFATQVTSPQYDDTMQAYLSCGETWSCVRQLIVSGHRPFRVGIGDTRAASESAHTQDCAALASSVI